MASPERDEILRRFRSVVNLSADELEQWLAGEESRRVGQRRDGAAESIGHASGRRILAILRTPVAALSGEDYAHMRKVVGFVRRHRAQEPANPVTSRWRWSLMNWGHDPLRGGEPR
jgi:hypothetical protein